MNKMCYSLLALCVCVSLFLCVCAWGMHSNSATVDASKLPIAAGRQEQSRCRRQQRWSRWASTNEIYAAWEKAKVKASTSKSIFVINEDYIRRFYSCFDIYLALLCAIFFAQPFSGMCLCVYAPFHSMPVHFSPSLGLCVCLCGSFYIYFAFSAYFAVSFGNSLFNEIQDGAIPFFSYTTTKALSLFLAMP